jgi:tRNA nucleotidyltransferase (CCA-adding enzyme)
MSEDKTAYEIVKCLCEEGWDAYVAGGAARDMLSGHTPDDYDIVTEAPYEIVKNLFNDRKVSLVGASFKVCIVDGIAVSTYRKDSYFGLSDKNSKIEKADTIQEDLARRDLTINSLAFCPYSGDIIDEYGGIDDLKNRVVKFTGNPKNRILEDPCRILRACRFLAKIEGEFDPDTFQALKKHSYLVKDHVTPERIRLEIIKALKYPKPGLFFDALHEIGVLNNIFPSLESCYGHDGGSHHNETIDEHIKIAGDLLPAQKPLLRLAGYLHDNGKPITGEIKDNELSFINHEKVGADIVESELKRLKFSIKEIIYIKNLIRYHMRSFENLTTPKAIRRMLKSFLDDGINWKDWIQLKIADNRATFGKENYKPQQIKQITLMIRNELKPTSVPVAFSAKDLAISGNDIIKLLNIEPGPEIGKVLNNLLELVLDDPQLNNNEKLLELAKNHQNL